MNVSITCYCKIDLQFSITTQGSLGGYSPKIHVQCSPKVHTKGIEWTNDISATRKEAAGSEVVRVSLDSRHIKLKLRNTLALSLVAPVTTKNYYYCCCCCCC